MCNGFWICSFILDRIIPHLCGNVKIKISSTLNSLQPTIVDYKEPNTLNNLICRSTSLIVIKLFICIWSAIVQSQLAQIENFWDSVSHTPKVISKNTTTKVVQKQDVERRWSITNSDLFQYVDGLNIECCYNLKTPKHMIKF